MTFPDTPVNRVRPCLHIGGGGDFPDRCCLTIGHHGPHVAATRYGLPPATWPNEEEAA